MNSVFYKMQMLAWVLLFVGCHSIVSAQEENEKLTKHIIIAVDQALPSNYRSLLSVNHGVTEAIDDALTLNGKSILNRGDFLSLVNFLADRGERSLANFALVPSDLHGKPMKWVKSDGNFLSFLRSGVWGEIMYRDNIGERESLLSAAKQACLVATQDGGKASKTYIVMITDDHYNGMDNVNHDLDNFVRASSIPFNEKLKEKQEYLNLCQKVSSLFSFNFIKESIIQGSYRAMLFEIVPNYTASLPVLLRYPSTYNLHRVKGGYKIDFEFEERNKKYNLDSLSLEVNGSIFSFSRNKERQVHLMIPISSVGSDSMNIIMKGWFIQKDGIYNGQWYSPFDQSLDSKSLDLLVNEKIALPKEATVFSIPMSDTFWLWYEDNASKAAFIWEVIIVILLLIIVALVVRSVVGMYIKTAQKYEPEDKIIKVKKIQ